MLNEKEIDAFNQARKNTNDCVGFDQYGSTDKDEKLYIKSVSDDYKKITVSNDREYFISEQYNSNPEFDEYDRIEWFPEDQWGDWDIIILSTAWGDWGFMHGS